MKTSENFKKTCLEVSCHIFINAYFYKVQWRKILKIFEKKKTLMIIWTGATVRNGPCTLTVAVILYRIARNAGKLLNYFQN